jgi:2'-5' RNA ligase
MTSGPPTRWVIVIFLPPTPADAAIRTLRDRFDPLAKHIDPHVTLVHPFVDDIEQPQLQAHIADVAAARSPFRLVLNEVTPTLDGYLFLNVKEGNDAVVGLRDQLYDGPLARHKSRLDTFVPHVTVGRASDEPTMQTALTEAAKLDLSAAVTVSTISAYCFDDRERRVVQFEVSLCS